eukprot:352834-Chlamydomonas_euryale.AAC.7
MKIIHGASALRCSRPQLHLEPEGTEHSRLSQPAGTSQLHAGSNIQRENDCSRREGWRIDPPLAILCLVPAWSPRPNINNLIKGVP